MTIAIAVMTYPWFISGYRLNDLVSGNRHSGSRSGPGISAGRLQPMSGGVGLARNPAGIGRGFRCFRRLNTSRDIAP